MEWLILALVSWVLFLVLVDWNQVKVNIWASLFAVIMQLGVDTNAMTHELYRVENRIINLLGSSGFFMLGPVAVIGFLMAQYHPKKRWLIVIYVTVITILFSLQEALLLSRKVLVYTDWHFTDSIVVNFVSMAALSWFTMIILGRGKT